MESIAANDGNFSERSSSFIFSKGMLWFWLNRLQSVLCPLVHFKLQYFPLSFAAIRSLDLLLSPFIIFVLFTFMYSYFQSANQKQCLLSWGPFLENPGNFSGLQSYFYLICF